MEIRKPETAIIFFQTYIIHLLLCNWYPHVQSNQEKQKKLLEMFNVNTKDTKQRH